MLCNFYEKFDFSARWISAADGAAKKNTCLEFFKRFDAEQPGDRILRISAESRYTLYINGTLIGRGPVRGTWSVNYFDAYDLTGILRKKDNFIAVRVYSMNDLGNFNYHPAGCGMIAEIPGILLSDTSWRVRHAPGWINTQELYTIQQGFKIEYDFNKGDEKWFLGENSENWEQAELFANDALSRKKLMPRHIPALQQSRVIPNLLKSAVVVPGEIPEGENIADLLDKEQWLDEPVVHTVSDNVYRVLPGKTGHTALVFNFGKHCSGRFETDITVNEPGVVLHVTCGEDLWHGRVRSSFRRHSSYAFYVDTFYLKPGVNHISNEFLAHGGTMVQLSIRNARKEIILTSPVYCDRRYPYQAASTFACSDPLLTGIWELCRETISACSTDTFEDCPWREHAFWVNDLIVENLTSLVLNGGTDLHRRCLELTFAQQYDSGWCPGVVPVKYDPEKPSLILAATNFFLFTVIDDYYRETGDVETVRKYLPNLRKILDAAETACDSSGLTASPKGLWNFFDWGYELNDYMFNDCRESKLNALYILAMKLYCRLCRIAGTEAPEQEFNKRIERITEAMKTFISAENGLIVDPVLKIDISDQSPSPSTLTSELSLAFALQCGVWDKEYDQRFTEALLSGKFLAPELYLSSVVFEVLIRRGYTAEVIKKIRKYWGQFMLMGMKTIPESGIHLIGKTGYWENGSFCHGFATYPVVVMRQVILGIKDVDDGFAGFTFAPEALDLEFASGSVVTPHGTIMVNWRRENDKISAELAVPAGCTARLLNGNTLSAGTHSLIL